MKGLTLLFALMVGMSFLGARKAVGVDPARAGVVSGLGPAKTTLPDRPCFDPSVSLNRGRLVIDGTPGNDYVEIDMVHERGPEIVYHYVEVTAFVTVKREVQRFCKRYNVDGVDSIQFNGEMGNDYLWFVHADSYYAPPVYARGGSGNDHLEGGGKADWLMGGSGNDDLFGGGDDDVLIGSSGDDKLLGGEGEDILIGGSGDDHLDGGRDQRVDLLVGDKGSDLFVGYYLCVHYNTGRNNRVIDFYTTPEPEDFFADFDEDEDIEEESIRKVFTN